MHSEDCWKNIKPELDRAELEDWNERYNAAAHAMQTGVKLEMELGVSDAHTPKHLRTGVNSALASEGGLAHLLVTKGIITQDEHTQAMTLAMEDERDLYQNRMPPHIKLG